MPVGLAVVKACAEDLRSLLEEADLTERKTLIRSFVKEVMITDRKVRLFVQPLCFLKEAFNREPNFCLIALWWS